MAPTLFNQHSGLRRLPNRHLVLRDRKTGRELQYTPEQVTLFKEFDDVLRNGRLVGAKLVLPAGYPEFTTLWAQDRNCPFQFCEYDLLSGSRGIRGVSIPIEILIQQESSSIMASGYSSPTAGLNPSAPRDEDDVRRERVMQRLITDRLERQQRMNDLIRSRQLSRAERRRDIGLADLLEEPAQKKSRKRGRKGNNGKDNAPPPAPESRKKPKRDSTHARPPTAPRNRDRAPVTSPDELPVDPVAGSSQVSSSTAPAAASPAQENEVAMDIDRPPQDHAAGSSSISGTSGAGAVDESSGFQPKKSLTKKKGKGKGKEKEKESSFVEGGLPDEELVDASD
ncbi:hypothetical protein C8Q79DRAFT_927234 [Trametes meyenii]|nr:hypothetical protein C8Q79DRAFT_927234 [Trametes meyenii]